MRRWYTIVSVLIVLSGLAWYWLREDPDLAAARELRAKLAALGENANDAERRALMQQMHGTMENLTDEQRRQLFQEMRGPFESRMRAAVDGYFALPDNLRQAYLDQQIREMEQRRAAMQQRFAQRPPGAAGQRGGPGGPGGDRPGGGGPGGPGGPGGGGGGREQRMLDSASPVDRARNTAYFTAIEARRKELGMPASSFGRR